MLKERFILASERIREIPEEKGMAAPAFEGFFHILARMILKVLLLSEAGDAERRADLAGELFGEIGPGSYEKSFACPSFACRNLGEDLGRPLSVLYYELYSMIVPALSGSREEILIRMELFLEIYQAFVIEYRETGGAPAGKYIICRLRDYFSDYFREETLRRLKALSAGDDFSAFSCFRPVVSPGDIEELERSAQTLAEELSSSPGADGLGEDVSYSCGLGVSFGSESFSALTAALKRRCLRALPYAGRCSLFDLREDLRAPAFPQADPRFYLDHREDLGLFLDESLRTRILQALEAVLSEEGENLFSFRGWILPGGEKKEESQTLRPDPMAVRLGRHQRKLLSAICEKEEDMIREAGLFLSEKDVFRLLPRKN